MHQASMTNDRRLHRHKNQIRGRWQGAHVLRLDGGPSVGGRIPSRKMAQRYWTKTPSEEERLHRRGGQALLK